MPLEALLTRIKEPVENLKKRVTGNAHIPRFPDKSRFVFSSSVDYQNGSDVQTLTLGIKAPFLTGDHSLINKDAQLSLVVESEDRLSFYHLVDDIIVRDSYDLKLEGATMLSDFFQGNEYAVEQSMGNGNIVGIPIKIINLERGIQLSILQDSITRKEIKTEQATETTTPMGATNLGNFSFSITQDYNIEKVSEHFNITPKEIKKFAGPYFKRKGLEICLTDTISGDALLYSLLLNPDVELPQDVLRSEYLHKLFGNFKNIKELSVKDLAILSGYNYTNLQVAFITNEELKTLYRKEHGTGGMVDIHKFVQECDTPRYASGNNKIIPYIIRGLEKIGYKPLENGALSHAK